MDKTHLANVKRESIKKGEREKVLPFILFKVTWKEVYSKYRDRLRGGP